jgi:hypothetical protein
VARSLTGTLRRSLPPPETRRTLIANGAQQLSGAALLLALPNLLDKTAYAEVVFVTVLLSLSGIADLGLSLVYARATPPLHAKGETEALRRWDATIVGFGTFGALIYTAIIVGIYLFQYGNLTHALILLPVPLLMFWANFQVTRMAARGDFREYLGVTLTRASLLTSAIPFAWLGGATGWFAAQLLGAVVVFARILRRWRTAWGLIDSATVMRYAGESVLLAFASVAWLQLINFARLYASANYPSVVLATYGVSTSAYQSAAALVLAGFVPTTVGILARVGVNSHDGYLHVNALLRRTSLLGVPAVILAGVCAWPVLRFVFPHYEFEPRMVFTLMLGIVFYPFLICWGNCLVGLRRPLLYGVVIALAGGAGWIAAHLADQREFPIGGAIGQLTALVVLPVLLLAANLVLANRKSRAVIWRGAGLFAVSLTLALASGAVYWFTHAGDSKFFF